MNNKVPCVGIHMIVNGLLSFKSSKGNFRLEKRNFSARNNGESGVNDPPLSRFDPPKSITSGQLDRSSFNEIRFMSSLFLHSFIVQTQEVT